MNIFYALVIFLSVACSKSKSVPTPSPTPTVPTVPTNTDTKIAIPLAGNAYITSGSAGYTEKIDDSETSTKGLTNWTSSNTIISVYFKILQPGKVDLYVKGNTISAGNTSSFKVTIGNTSVTKDLSSTATSDIAIGSFNFSNAGYIKVDIQGVSKTGSNFGEITDLIVQGNAVTSTMLYVKDNLERHYYWGRRGPSVHLNYTVPTTVGNIKWLYNELTVPVGDDAIGSYMMANGFDGGYFGMQVKSATERWILFSLWDPANGTTVSTRVGENVVAQRFGGEGTGGQSYFIYNWKAGNTYKFLSQAIPDGAGNTLYSSWFYAPEVGSWKFMATWKRKETTANKYFTGFHSFLENFNNNTGYLGRSVNYDNVWVKGEMGEWKEITTAKLNGDNIASINYRQDFAGGLRNNKFYMQNGGFFSPQVLLNTVYNKTPLGIAPNVDLTTLP